MINELRGDGADVEPVPVTERVRLVDDLIEQVRSVEGVAEVIGDVSFDAHLVEAADQPQVVESSAPSWGHAWRSAAMTPFDLVAGREPAAAGEVVIDDASVRRVGVEVGETVVVVASGRLMDVVVVGIAAPSAGSLEQQSALFFTDDDVAQLYAHPGSVDVIGVTVESGADIAATAGRLEQALGEGVAVRTGGGRGKAEFLHSVESNIRLIAIAGSLAGIGMAVAVFVIAGTLTLVVQQRQREIALLRAIAATPRQIRRKIRIETFVVTALAAAVGVWPGVLLASQLVRAMIDQGLLPPTFEHQAGPLPLLVAIVAAMAVAQLAAYIAGRRASRMPPTQALSPHTAQLPQLGWARATLGAVALAGSVALCVVAMSFNVTIALSVSPAIVIVAMVTVGLFAPRLVSAGVRLIGIPLRWFGAGGFLAAENTRASARRMASAITPLVLLVGVAGMTVFQQTTLAQEADRQSEARHVADMVIAAGAGGLTAGSVDVLASQTSIVSAVGLLPTDVYAGGNLDIYAAQAVTPGRLDEVLDLGVTAGALTGLSPGEVAISGTAAKAMSLRAGDVATLRLGDGSPLRATVAAVYDRGLGFADVLIAWDDAADHVSDPVVTTVLVRTAAGGAEEVSRFARAAPSAVVGDADLLRDIEGVNAKTQAWVSYTLLGLIVVFVALAVANTLVMVTVERSRESALLRLVGATERQVRHMMRCETLIVVAAGCLLGTVVAAGALLPFTKVVTGSFVPTTPLKWCAVIVGGALILGLIATMVPTRMALREPPIAVFDRHA